VHFDFLLPGKGGRRNSKFAKEIPQIGILIWPLMAVNMMTYSLTWTVNQGKSLDFLTFT
jgi:hypothetical protein